MIARNPDGLRFADLIAAAERLEQRAADIQAGAEALEPIDARAARRLASMARQSEQEALTFRNIAPLFADHPPGRRD